MPTKRKAPSQVEVVHPKKRVITPCHRHGVKYTCNHEGCANKAKRGGVCRRHGAAVTLCSHDGCTNHAKEGGLCCRHGAKVARKAKVVCSHNGCNNIVRKWGVCRRHGAKDTPKLCSHEGCTAQARNGLVCMRHGAKNARAKDAVTMDAIELRKIKAEKEDYVQDMKSAAASALLSLSSSCSALQN